MIKLRYLFSSQVKFPHPRILAYSHDPVSIYTKPEVSEPLYMNIYQSGSDKIQKQLHRLKVERLRKGGQEFIYSSNKVGIAVGYKEKPFDTGAKVCRETRSKGFNNLIVVENELDIQNFSKFISGVILANYKFKLVGNQTEQQQKQDEQKGIYQLLQELYLEEKLYNESLVQENIKISYYKNYARELANQRQNGSTYFFLKEVQELFKDNTNVKIETLIGDELLNQDMNLIHAVGRGSQQPPIMINLTYNGNPNDSKLHCFVGKGITFDTGGYHLKPYGSMEKMFLDKSGACNVLAAFRGAVEMGLQINLTVTIGLAENAIGNQSYKPSEIIKSHRGLTVEINNTDAEGRLVLADCISWTQQYRNPSNMIEISTLTGACWAALGDNTAGIFSNNDQLVQEITSIGEENQESFWRLPVTSEHFEMMKGDHSDLDNVGKGKVCGSQKAAAFLMSFLDKEKNIPFAHLDIAGPMEAKSDKGINSTGATGFGTFTLLKYLIKNQI